MYEYVMYNGNIYRHQWNIFTKKQCFVTQFKEKTDDSFYDYLDDLDRYARDIGNDEIYDLYTVSFCISYKEPGDTEEGDHWYNANEEGNYRLPVKIENDEVSISLYVKTGEEVNTEGWTSLETLPGGGYSERGWYSKIINIRECDKLRVTYTYKVFEGQYFFRPYKKEVEVIMTPEEFKAEMLKHRLSNL